MVLNKLDLNNFRLFKKLQIEFDQGVNLITGMNGCGKTSILESIYYLAITKSFRASQDNNAINYNSDFFDISGLINTDAQQNKTTRVYFSAKEGKHLFLDNQEINKYSDYIGFIPCVLLQPEDMKLTLGAPADRRKFMDILLSQVSPVYLDDLKTYRRVLLQRNALFSSEDKNQITEQIDVWNKQLIESGAAIIEKRLHLVSFMNQNLQSYYNNFSNQEDLIHSSYISTVAGEHTQLSLKEIKDLFQKKLSTLFKYEIEKQATAIGPHRDDLNFYKNNRFFKEFGSQGENKSLIIALKILEWDYLSQQRTTQPLLLFDDIFGELDSSRMTGLMRFLKDIGQAFITTTLEDKFSKQVMNKEIKLERSITAYA